MRRHASRQALWPVPGSKGSAEEIKDAAKALQLAAAGLKLVLNRVKRNLTRIFFIDMFKSIYGVTSI